MKTIKALVIPHPVNEPVFEVDVPADPEELDAKCSGLIFGHLNGTVGAAGFGPTMLFFDETAGDRDDRDDTINPRANELWDYLAARRGSALTHTADDEPLYGTFIAVGHGTGSVTDDDSMTDVSEEIVRFPFRSA
jgi:hypothetical protein